MKAMLRRTSTRGLEDNADLDDSKSVRSSATASTAAAALRMGAGALKSKFAAPFKRSKSSGNNRGGESDGDNGSVGESSQYIPENVNITNVSAKAATEEASLLRQRLREFQQAMEAEKRKAASLEKSLHGEQTKSQAKISELQILLEQERANYQSLVNGDAIDDIVKQQAEALQGYQELIDGLQSRIELLSTDAERAEHERDEAHAALKSEQTSSRFQMAALEKENAALKALLANAETDESRRLEKEAEDLRQRLAQLESDNMRLRKASETQSKSSKGDSEKVRRLEQEKADLQSACDAEQARTRALQNKVVSLEKELSAHIGRVQDDIEIANMRAELASAKAQLESKHNELASQATSAEAELARIESRCQALEAEKNEANAANQALEEELGRIKADLTKYMHVEQDEHFQRARAAAQQLLKQKKITKAEYDEVIKAAREAANRVWNGA